METKVKSKCNIICRGTVISFTIKDITDTFRKATIGIKDNTLNSTVFVDLNDRKNLEFGGNRISLEGLRDYFIDDLGKPTNKGINAFGMDLHKYKYNGKNGVKIYTNQQVFKLSPLRENDDEGSIFDVVGYVEKINEKEDGSTKVTVGFLADEWNKDLGENKPVVHRMVFDYDGDCYIQEDGEWVEAGDFPPFDVGDEITMKGDIVFSLGKRDRYGIATGSDVKQGYFIRRIFKVNEIPSSEDFEKYCALKSNNTRQASRNVTKSTRKKTDNAKYQSDIVRTNKPAMTDDMDVSMNVNEEIPKTDRVNQDVVSEPVTNDNVSDEDLDDWDIDF